MYADYVPCQGNRTAVDTHLQAWRNVIQLETADDSNWVIRRRIHLDLLITNSSPFEAMMEHRERPRSKQSGFEVNLVVGEITIQMILQADPGGLGERREKVVNFLCSSLCR